MLTRTRYIIHADFPCLHSAVSQIDRGGVEDSYRARVPYLGSEYSKLPGKRAGVTELSVLFSLVLVHVLNL